LRAREEAEEIHMKDLQEVVGKVSMYLYWHDEEPVQLVLDIGTGKQLIKLPPGVRFKSKVSDSVIARSDLVGVVYEKGEYRLRVIA